MNKNLSNSLMVLTSSLFAVFVVEMAVRVLNIPPSPLEPLPIPSYQLSQNPIIGFEFRPNYKMTDKPIDVSHRGYAINSVGFRDYEYTERKSANVYRIVVIGDSTTAGNGVPNLDDIYAKQLEKMLNVQSQNGRLYEVLNMGVGGFHTMQEAEMLRFKGLKYDPDLVLLTFCMNDFALHADGQVHKQLSSRNRSTREPVFSLFKFVVNNSRLAFILYHRFHSGNSTYDQWYDEHVLKGRSTVKAGFDLLSELQKKHGFQARVLILPKFSMPFSEYNLYDIHEKVFEEAKGLEGISVIDLLDRFKTVDEGAQVFAYDGLHLNAYGHETMAEILVPIVKVAEQSVQFKGR